MGTVLQKTYTRPVPAGRGRHRQGQETPARGPVGGRDEADRGRSPNDSGRPGRGPGQVEHLLCEVPQRGRQDCDGPDRVSGSRDGEAGPSRLEKEADLIRAGVATRAETHLARRMAEPIEDHIDAYLATLAGSRMHRLNTGAICGRWPGNAAGLPGGHEAIRPGDLAGLRVADRGRQAEAVGPIPQRAIRRRSCPSATGA